MILIHRTYEVVSHESAEYGDAEERGYLSEDQPVTFRELVDILGNHPHSSCMPASGDTTEWYSDESDADYRTGDRTTTSVHYSRSNPANNVKYWQWAAIAAGIVKKTNKERKA